MNEDANMIKGIPLSMTDREDSIYWYFDRKGNYTVKGGYAAAILHKTTQAPSTSAETNTWWKLLWNLNVDPKIKAFLWKASSNAIPTRTGLARRKFIDYDVCPICNYGQETVEHALFHCSEVQTVWQLLTLCMDVSKTKKLNTVGIFSLIHSWVKGDEMDMIATVVWAIWNRRNKWVMQNHREQPTDTYNWAIQHITEYKQANQRQNRRGDSDAHLNPIPKVWSPPLTGTLKLMSMLPSMRLTLAAA